MKVLIVGFSKIKYMPYLNFHLEKYKSDKVDVIYWNRDNSDDIDLSRCLNNIYQFNYCIGFNKIEKLFAFIKFKHFCSKILNKNTYDRIVLLHTFPAFLLSSKLIKSYKNQYIFDYRDITYEKYSFFKKRVAKIVVNSKYTFVSSEGFKQYLPNCEKIYVTHNIMKIDLEESKKIKKEEFDGNINLSFWGFIRGFEVNKKLINECAKKKHIFVNYYGFYSKDVKKLQKYVLENDYVNIAFYGSYNNDEKVKFIKNTYLIHNLYDRNDKNMMVAMSNKFYDGIIYKTPQVCCKNSLMGNIVEKNGLGIAIDIDDQNFIDDIIHYYLNLNFEEFNKNCEKYLNKVIKEYEISLSLK